MSDVVTTLSATRRRILTFALAAFGTVLFLALGLPLPFLFGPMAACLIAALAHVPIKGFGQVSLAARTILGVAVGASITPALFAELPRMVTSIALVPLFIAVIALVCTLATAPDGMVLPSTRAGWASVVYMALVAGALAMLAQTWAQAHLPPTRTALIMSMEPVFAATFAVWLGGEATTARMLGGGLMVLTAMLVVELRPPRSQHPPGPHPSPDDGPIEGQVTHLAV